MPEEFDFSRAPADRKLIDLLKAELKVGFAFAKLTKVRRNMGRHEHYKRDMLVALRAMESVRRSEDRILDAEARRAIQDRRKQLEQLVLSL